MEKECPYRPITLPQQQHLENVELQRYANKYADFIDLSFISSKEEKRRLPLTGLSPAQLTRCLFGTLLTWFENKAVCIPQTL